MPVFWEHGVVTVAGTLVVSRPRGAWLDRRRAYRIVVDGKVKGKVKDGQELALVLEPGRHTIEARIDWSGSEPASLHVGPGATVRMSVESRGNPFRAPKVRPA